MTDWTTTRAAMAADHDRLAAVLGRPPRLHAGLWALRLYRVGHWLHRRGHKTPARLLWSFNLLLTGADLECAVVIGPGCVMRKPRGVIMYGAIGPDCTLGTQCGVGGLLRGAPAPRGERGLRPDVGARCVLGDRSLVLGSAVIGDDCTITAGCTVLQDLPAGSTIERRPGAWRTMRMGLHRRPRPAHAGDATLGAVIRTDVARSVMENAGTHAAVGAIRFWAHLILPAVQGVVLFRLAHALHARGWRRAAALLARINTKVYGLTIHPGSRIGPGIFIPHTVGVSFCGSAGPLLSLFPFCSVGPGTWPGLRSDLPADAPVLGTDVGIGAQAEVVGAVTLGDLVLVGVQARVERDIAEGLTVVPRPNWHHVPPPADIAGMQPQAAN
ncbi:hypothetical protein ACQW02_08595 [Humitalea sp. 24SJ18S-53]|uniref:hypothetical protein n=1 Tax=Humitalea sp. 24SJ18S-53 TaxID=3422307 RepID=UPI003D66B9C7